MKRIKRIKRILLTVATALCLTAGVGGIAAYKNVASAQTTKTGFYVEDGAAVRLKSEHEKFGIRFSANVGERVEGATYNMLIAPVQLVDLYEADTTENKADIITYLKAYAESKGGSLSIVENCEVDENGIMTGAIVNVLWKNINRKFVGVAYYEKDGVITVAEYADDKERSIVDVSKNALESGLYTETSDIQILFEKVRYGEMLENGATAEEKQSEAYQYEYFYGASVNENTVTTAANTVSITLNGLNGSIENNALTLAFNGNGANGATIDFGVIPAGHYRVNLAHTLVDGTFSSTITQNGVTELATVWETKELGDNIYEFYFEQETEGNASFTISASDTATAGTVTLDTISLEPVSLAEFEFSRDEYMFGVGGLAKNINGSEGNYCDTKVTTDWVAEFDETMGIESQRVWMSIPHIVKRADSSNELSIDADLAAQFHKHFKALKNAGVKRIMVMLSRFVYPYDYTVDDKNVAPDPTDEATVYKAWLEMLYQAYKLIAKEFPEVSLWECGNEYDLETFLHKNGYKTETAKGDSAVTGPYVFSQSVAAQITADICYLANKAFKLYNPNNKIVLPGMSKDAATISSSLLEKEDYYLDKLYDHIESGNFPTLETEKVTDVDKYFDVIAWHCYAEDVTGFESYNDTLLNIMAEHNDADRRVWITELGFTETKFGGKGTAEAQNTIANLTQDILVSLEQQKYANIESVFFFRMSDTVLMGDSGQSCFGMYYSPNATENTNQAKPWAAVLYNYFNGTTVTTDTISMYQALKTLEQENFDSAVSINDVAVYRTSNRLSLEIVDDGNGGKALKATKADGGYASVVLSFGTLSAGNYTLTMDIQNEGYQAILQAFTLSDNGKAPWENVVAQEMGYTGGVNSIFQLATVSGNTYTLTFSLAEEYTNFGIGLSTNTDTVGESIIIDNMQLTQSNAVQAVDFEDGNNAKATAAKGLGGVDVAPVAANTSSLTSSFETENGNTYYKVQFLGYNSWSVINLGYLSAGEYQVRLDMKLLQGTINGRFVRNVGGTMTDLTEDDYVRVNDTYIFPISLAEDCADFYIGYRSVKDTGADFTVAFDNIYIEEPTVYELTTIGKTEATFDAAEKAAWQYGVYAKGTVVDIIDGAATLNVTGTEQLVLSLGNVTKGNYKLKFDVELTGGYPAILQMVTGLSVDSATGLASWEALTTLYNAAGKTLDTFATPNGTTYELMLRFDNDYTNVGLILINNQADLTCGITLDNISFKEMTYSVKQTLQSFDSSLIGKAGWSAKPGLINVANAHADYSGTFNGVIEDGAYKATINGNMTYSRVNLGWFEAGTYTFTFDAKASGANLNGAWTLTTCSDHPTSPDTALDGAVHNRTATTFTEEWTTYSKTITLTDGAFIKMGVIRGDGTSTLDATVYMDNFTVQSAVEFRTLGSETVTFDEEDKGAWEYGVYARNSQVSVEDGMAVLNTTGVEQLVLSLGNVTKGNYRLKFDAEIEGGYAAILQVVTGLDANPKTGLASWAELTTLYNAAGKQLNEFATPNGNTYELTLRFDNDYENVGFILINNIADQVCSISLDNILFEKIDYMEKQTIQSFDGALLGNAGWSAKPGLINVANAHVDYSGTFNGVIEDGAYKATINANMAYSRVNLGWFEAGTYTFTFDAKASGANLNGAWTLTTCSDHPTSPDTALDGAVHNRTAATFTEDWTTYSYTITLTEGAFIKMGVIRGDGTSTLDATVYMDNFTVQRLYELKTIGADAATFDQEGKAAWEYGVYARNVLVDTVNGEAALNVTGVEQLVLSLGSVTKGIYKLKFDAEIIGGYAAILQVVTDLQINAKTGLASWGDLTTLYNGSGKPLSAFATPNGNTYELTLSFYNDYSNVGLILINNVADLTCGITLDNISFAALDYTEKQTVQAFNGSLLGKGGWSAKPTLGFVANAHVDYSGTFNGGIEDGAYKATINGNMTYSRVNLGWFEAGTYTFTFDAKATGTNLNGAWTLTTCSDHPTSPDTALDGAVHNRTLATFTEDWTTYSYTITLTEGAFIKMGVIRGIDTSTLDAVVYMDNFTVQKTA